MDSSQTSTSTLPAPQHATTPRTLRSSNRKASGLGGILTASTPNLSGLYAAHSRLAAPSLSHKASLANLTPSTLSSIPDASESYAFDSLNVSPPRKNMAPSPFTPRVGAGDSLAVGDTVDVPGNMHGTVCFIGTVQGKKGTFAGVELHPDFASRGKNSGDVDGVSYFSTATPGAGIFLPLSKAVKREPSPNASVLNSFPMTPSSATGGGLKPGTQNSVNYTPPTPSLTKFSQSVGPGRAPSPLGKKPRPSLPRPESPMRRLQMTPASRPNIPTPSKSLPRYGSPITSKFSKSVHGGPPLGDPSKKGMLRPDRNVGVGPRSASALSGPVSAFTDDETTPLANGRIKASEVSRPVSALRLRAPSRAAAHDEEMERLRAELAEKDKQLKEQTATLVDMETSLTEVQNLMEQAGAEGPPRRGSLDDKDTAALKALVREKNEKIAMLTAEFDAHRADFRSTIDTLEMASTETERVYEKRIEELMQEIHDVQDRTSDVDVVAQQLKQLEELVQELEEGLEDARRGEAEARGEAEFLRGEVERTRTELRREREKAAGGMDGANGAVNGDKTNISKELEQKEDEIRGLKAIIHSLSRDSVPGELDRPYLPRSASIQNHGRQPSADGRVAREKLEREVADLRSQLESRAKREEEMEQEMDKLRRSSSTTTARGSGTNNRSSVRDSRDTVVLAKDFEARPPESRKMRGRGSTLDTMPESDALSSATENSTLWCELCETSGHDILTCTNMFPPGSQHDALLKADAKTNGGSADAREGLRGLPPNAGREEYKPAPLSPLKTTAPEPPAAAVVRILPNPMDSGPVAGKESGVVDAGKWCALCERDGHDSVDCPFEDAF